MYVPPANEMPPEGVRDFVAEIGAAHLVTVGAEGRPYATQLPIVWRGDVVEGHLALANPHARVLRDGDAALLIIQGAQAYVSPRWYAAKAQHGRVVPTWNYSTVHLEGVVTVRPDPEWLRGAVERLTDAHEVHAADPWHVDDAPERFIAGQLRGIVGIEIAVTAVHAKDKLSQNRSGADRERVSDELDAGSDEERAVGAAMRTSLDGSDAPGRVRSAGDG